MPFSLYRTLLPEVHPSLEQKNSSPCVISAEDEVKLLGGFQAKPWGNKIDGIYILQGEDRIVVELLSLRSDAKTIRELAAHSADNKDPNKVLIYLHLKPGHSEFDLLGPFYVNKKNVDGLFIKDAYDPKQLLNLVQDLVNGEIRNRIPMKIVNLDETARKLASIPYADAAMKEKIIESALRSLREDIRVFPSPYVFLAKLCSLEQARISKSNLWTEARKSNLTVDTSLPTIEAETGHSPISPWQMTPSAGRGHW